MKRKPGIWVQYDQIQGEWGWRITDGNVYYWSGKAWRTEYEAERAARISFLDYFQATVEIPTTRFFRTAVEYATASLREDRQK